METVIENSTEHIYQNIKNIQTKNIDTNEIDTNKLI